MKNFIIMMLMLCIGWSVALSAPSLGESKSKCKIELKENVKDVLKNQISETNVVLEVDGRIVKLSEYSIELKSSISMSTNYVKESFMYYDPGAYKFTNILITHSGIATLNKSDFEKNKLTIYTFKSFMRGKKLAQKDCLNYRNKPNCN